MIITSDFYWLLFGYSESNNYLCVNNDKITVQRFKKKRL